MDELYVIRNNHVRILENHIEKLYMIKKNLTIIQQQSEDSKLIGKIIIWEK